MDLKRLQEAVVSISREAGDAVMKVYNCSDFDVKLKSDSSPLTEADMAAHKSIVGGLAKISDFPILSEEAAEISWVQRSAWDTYWLVDPLDGTKEFIKRNGEFTVNIALIHHGKPILGVVYAPVTNIVYMGTSTGGAYKIEGIGEATPISVSSLPLPGEPWRIVGSRSHQSEEFVDFVSSIDNKTVVPMGSSLKLCLVAEGLADLYPRLGPTCEWDTAAAQAVVEAAGGQVVVRGSLKALQYNAKESLLNPEFIVCSAIHDLWSE